MVRSRTRYHTWRQTSMSHWKILRNTCDVLQSAVFMINRRKQKGACIPCLCAICLGIVCRADEWKVSGNGFEGVARLPGTLADAGLGVRQNYETWSHIKDRVEKGALRLSHVYRGEATWSRMVEVPETPSCRRL